LTNCGCGNNWGPGCTCSSPIIVVPQTSAPVTITSPTPSSISVIPGAPTVIAAPNPPAPVQATQAINVIPQPGTNVYAVAGVQGIQGSADKYSALIFTGGSISPNIHSGIVTSDSSGAQGLAYTVGDTIIGVSQNVYGLAFYGIITNYNPENGVMGISFTAVTGSGADDYWYINPSGAAGLQGPAGVQGPAGSGAQGVQGIQGVQGTTPKTSYVYTQGSPSTVWTINHNLNFYPNLTIEDSAGSIVEGEVAYLSLNSLQVTFSGGFSGTAYLS